MIFPHNLTFLAYFYTDNNVKLLNILYVSSVPNDNPAHSNHLDSSIIFGTYPHGPASYGSSGVPTFIFPINLVVLSATSAISS